MLTLTISSHTDISWAISFSDTFACLPSTLPCSSVQFIAAFILVHLAETLLFVWWLTVYCTGLKTCKKLFISFTAVRFCEYLFESVTLDFKPCPWYCSFDSATASMLLGKELLNVCFGIWHSFDAFFRWTEFQMASDSLQEAHSKQLALLLNANTLYYHNGFVFQML